MRFTRLLAPLALVVVLGAACGGGNGGGGGGDGDGPTATDTVVMVDNAFEPESFAVSGGSVSLDNQGQALHSFTVADLGIDEDVQPGASAAADIAADAGTYAVTCTYHPEMTATMTVE